VLAAGLKDLVPALGLPVGGQAGLGEQPLVEEQHPPVGADGDAVALALELDDAGHRLGDLRPAVPVVDLGPDHLVQRLQEPGLGELPHPGAVRGEHVGVGAGAQVQGQLGLDVLVVGAGADVLDRHLAALVGHLLLEVGDHPVLQPARLGGVLPSLDRVGLQLEGDGP